jgi:hypothetical protein
MKGPITLADSERIKLALRESIPTVKSSHRVEAMARGLGWNTNAAMRAVLADAPAPINLDDDAFLTYLAAHDFPVARGILDSAVEKAIGLTSHSAIRAVMDKMPELGRGGFFVHDRRQGTLKENRQQHEQGRANMLLDDAIGEFERAVEFLEHRGQRATLNRQVTSYTWKHSAEKFHRAAGADNDYVANGMMIAAAIHLGFKVVRDGYGPNAFLNVAEIKSVGPRRRSDGTATHRGGKQRLAAWRNLMVAGINAGLEQKVFGLAEDENSWSGDGHTYRFTFAGLPAVAHVRDIGFGELGLHVAVNPTARCESVIEFDAAGLEAGDGFASGFMERRSGKWLMSSGKPCNAFRRDFLPVIAAASVEPNGYLDHGRVMM